MNKQIIITVLITTMVLIGGFFLYKYEIQRNQTAYESGYTNGLLYTQQTGKIVIMDNEALTEKTIEEVCNYLIQDLNSNQGGK